MKWDISSILKICSQKALLQELRKSKHGLEKECLRVDKEGNLSQKLHPKDFGSALTNPYLCMDFSEAQPELITPPFNTEEAALNCLHEIHQFMYQHLEDELLWPSSAPCILEDESTIPIADFGISDKGRIRNIYRRGLSYRYGRVMQSLSGIHYNFSFSEGFIDLLHHHLDPGSDRKDFASNLYLHIIRNFLRYGWMNTYFFGATPAVDKTFFKYNRGLLQELDQYTLYGEYATSIRLSHCGYYSRIQEQMSVSYNHFHRYLKDLSKALTTPRAKYKKIGLFKDKKQIQLNINNLQMEAEHY